MKLVCSNIVRILRGIGVGTAHSSFCRTKILSVENTHRLVVSEDLVSRPTILEAEGHYAECFWNAEGGPMRPRVGLRGPEWRLKGD